MFSGLFGFSLFCSLLVGSLLCFNFAQCCALGLLSSVQFLRDSLRSVAEVFFCLFSEQFRDF